MPGVLFDTENFVIEQLEGPITHRDFLLLAGIYKRAHPDRGNIPLTELKSTLEEDHANGDVYSSALFVARNQMDNRLVGAAMVKLAESGETHGLHIDELFVEARSRGRSIGRQLLKTCISFAEDTEAAYVQLDHEPMGNEGTHLFHSMDFMPNSQGLLELDLTK